MIKTEQITYGDVNSELKFQGTISFDDESTSPRPGILVCHAYGGHSEFDIQKSEKLAELGYFAFAMDLYGVLARGFTRIAPLSTKHLYKANTSKLG